MEEQIAQQYKELFYHSDEVKRIALDIMHTMLDDLNLRSEKSIGNVYHLQITPVLHYHLSDWFKLWGRCGSTDVLCYQIAGNEVFITLGKTNKILDNE